MSNGNEIMLFCEASLFSRPESQVKNANFSNIFGTFQFIRQPDSIWKLHFVIKRCPKKKKKMTDVKHFSYLEMVEAKY